MYFYSLNTVDYASEITRKKQILSYLFSNYNVINYKLYHELIFYAININNQYMSYVLLAC